MPGLVCDQETPWRNDPVATRRAVLALLARCPQDAWWSPASRRTSKAMTNQEFRGLVFASQKVRGGDQVLDIG